MCVRVGLRVGGGGVPGEGWPQCYTTEGIYEPIPTNVGLAH